MVERLTPRERTTRDIPINWAIRLHRSHRNTGPAAIEFGAGDSAAPVVDSDDTDELEMDETAIDKTPTPGIERHEVEPVVQRTLGNRL
jgi:hypothetical protein